MPTSTRGSKLNLQIYQEACEWLINLRTGGTEAVIRERFDAWLRQSPEHVRAYLEVSATWEDASLHDPLRAVSADAHIARARAEGNLVSIDTGGIRSPTRPREQSKHLIAGGPGPVVRAMAAAIIAALVAVGLEAYSNRGMYTTKIGEERSVSLADGSVIDLNAESRVRVRFSRRTREVDLLGGEALFKVVHNSARPFVVRSGAAIVRDVGTEFDVYQKMRSTTVTVIEGRVAVAMSSLAPTPSGPERSGGAAWAAPGRAPPAGHSPSSNPSGQGANLNVHAPGVGADRQEVVLTAGEQVTVLPWAILRPIHISVVVTTAWTRRKLVFDSVPLSQVVQSFNRYNARPIVIDDPALDHFRVIGVFSSTDPSSLLRFLSTQPGISVVENDKEVRITREKP